MSPYTPRSQQTPHLHSDARRGAGPPTIESFALDTLGSFTLDDSEPASRPPSRLSEAAYPATAPSEPAEHPQNKKMGIQAGAIYHRHYPALKRFSWVWRILATYTSFMTWCVVRAQGGPPDRSEGAGP